MSTRIEVTGPVGYFVQSGGGGYSLLGTAQFRPRFLMRYEWEPVYNDIGGGIPFDMQYMGQDALVMGDLTKFDQKVLEGLQSLPKMSQGGTWGENLEGDIGSLMIQEGLAAQLALVFPYGGGVKPGTQLPSGITFQQAWLLGPDDIQAGTRHEIVRVIFQCLRTYDPNTGAFTLFTSGASAGSVR